MKVIEFLPIFIQGLWKFFMYWWPVLLFATIQLFRLWRWEKRENERVNKAYQRDNPKRSNNKKHAI